MAIALATLASEDLTCIGVGLLIGRGELNPWIGVIACLLGIYVGDLGLWAVGRTLRGGLLNRPWIASRLPVGRLHQLGDWFDQQGWRVVVASRFLPGTRVALYVASGMLGRKTGDFALWSLVAACLWTPLIVGGVALSGLPAVRVLERLLQHQVLALLVGALVIWLAIRLIGQLCTPRSRFRLQVALQRWRRYEFWPVWLFYAPLLPYLIYLAARHRGVTTLTAVNPGIPHSGVVGESKMAILSHLPPERIVPSALIATGPLDDRCAKLVTIMRERPWQFPLILKPDASQRGAGVRLLGDLSACRTYLAGHPAPVLAQTYHPGPHEVGVFYYRLPGEPHGRIFSITEKVFPVLIGDGRSSLAQLIRAHPRYRLQSNVFLTRHASQADRVLALGESFTLALAGNHCQGTLFRDGWHLHTPELEAAIDSVARRFKGFYMGRFDIRFASVDDFRIGVDWSIVELNGVTSESTNLYDPSWSLIDAYRTLARQWKLAFQIGSINRARGQQATPLTALVAEIRSYYRNRPATVLAD